MLTTVFHTTGPNACHVEDISGGDKQVVLMRGRLDLRSGDISPRTFPLESASYRRKRSTEISHSTQFCSDCSASVTAGPAAPGPQHPLFEDCDI